MRYAKNQYHQFGKARYEQASMRRSAIRSAQHLSYYAANTLGCGTIPRTHACIVCHGPAAKTLCGACARLTMHGAPTYLTVHPLTTALRPSRWYEILRTYKTTHPEHAWLLASILSARRPALCAPAGVRVTIVPSTRHPAPHPLLRVVQAVLPGVTANVHYRGGGMRRCAYEPDAFTTTGVARQHILLLDDLWVSGARMMSVAGALIRDGAASVQLIPIARHVALQYYGKHHPYVQQCHAEAA
jgi:hypothetical protein